MRAKRYSSPPSPSLVSSVRVEPWLNGPLASMVCSSRSTNGEGDAASDGPNGFVPTFSLLNGVTSIAAKM